MALFTINRYLGEEEETASTNSETRSQALLAKLQERAKSKEQQSLAAKVNDKETSVVQTNLVGKKRKSEQQETKKKLHKKSRKEDVESQHEAKDKADPVEPAQTVTSDQTKKNRKKKDKKKTVKKEEEQGPDPSEKSLKAMEKAEGHNEVKGGVKTDVSQPDLSSNISGKTSSGTSFHILGGFEMKKAEKVNMFLPKWLADPDVIQRDITSNLIPLHELTYISPVLRKQLENNGIRSLFPVQAEVIPAILESVKSGLLIGPGGYRPRDICVSAPTGSGKTLTFVIPIVQALLNRVVCEVRALAVLPTKELAQQVYRVFCTYTERTNLKVVMAAGQKPFAAEQEALLDTKTGMCCSLADIVVATPGRLVDHINKNDNFSLQHLRFLIIDEADRMIDSMDQAWLSQLTQVVFKCRRASETSNIFRRVEPGPITVASLSPPQMPLQKLLFSATLTHNPEKLKQLGLYQPRLFSSTHNSTNSSTRTQEKFNFPQGLTEYYVLSTLSKKPLLILHFLLRLKFNPILCFMNSREAAHRLFLLVKLYGGVEVAEFSSRLSLSERKKNLKNFEQGKIPLLISTDAAARGIDIKGVKCVINYDAPQFIRPYIHRVGRTARAGNAGVALTFVLGVQKERFVKMVLDAGSPGIQMHSVKPESLKGMESRYEQVLEELGKVIREENARKRF